MKRPVVVGSRGSRLALVQTRSILDGLAGIHPGREFRLVEVRTTGDIQSTTPLGEIATHGVFVKELQVQLLDGRIDAAVHSLKDLPLAGHPDLEIAAVPPRADARDALVSRSEKLAELAPGSIVGTGSPRRKAQLLAFRPDLEVKEIRGNVETRLRKVEAGELAAIIVAAAGLIRLGLQGRMTELLPTDRFLPEPGQGALAVEVRKGDRAILELVRPLEDPSTRTCVFAERAFALALGGGCSVPVACLGTLSGRTLELRGMIVGAERLHFAFEAGPAGFSEAVAERLADRLRKAALSSDASGFERK